MAIILGLIVFFIIGIILYHFWLTNGYCFKMVEKLHGTGLPRPIPILGNSHLFSSDTEGNYKLFLKFSKMNSRLFRVWLLHEPYIIIYNAKDTETLLKSTTHITKSSAYKFTLAWIGTGLLTSTGPKWKSRRKIITPAFHFQILEDFSDVFEANSRILVQKLKDFVDKPSFDVFPFCNLYALDNICETAMGVNVNAQLDSNSKYVRAIKDMCNIVNVRVYQPWLGPDFIFNLSKWAKIQKNALSIIHNQTTSTIKARRKLFKKSDNDSETRRKLVFLDLLLQSESNLSDEDIREEVDTFMFEGHDTVTSGLSFCLYLLSQNPDSQEKAYEEQIEILGKTNRPITHKDYQEMKYLERVIKESQRLYPSVPIYGRYMHEDLKLHDGQILPKGSQISLLVPVLHRDPEYWPEPEKFNPDNFLPEINRNPYAYIPFSAGPRNCIGQKFALLEMKACISAILRNFILLPCEKSKQVVPVAEIVLISKTGVNICLKRRE